MSGTLHLVATPIGNLEDITLRALRVLREADMIAAEDTRVTRKLTSHYDIHTPLIAYNQHSKGSRARAILDMLTAGKNVALVSDAGTPGISDPGHELISMCIEVGVRIEPIPGASAVISALIVSGMPVTRFVFDAFPPRKSAERTSFFESVRLEPRTLCIYEAPTRLLATLRSARTVLGNRRVSVMREITKLFEEVFRGTIDGAIDHFSAGKIRGEIVIVIEGSADHKPDANAPAVLERRLAEMVSSGMTERDAVRACALEMRLPRRQVYETWLRMKNARESESQCPASVPDSNAANVGGVQV